MYNPEKLATGYTRHKTKTMKLATFGIHDTRRLITNKEHKTKFIARS
jgi:hypothetical protein